MDGLREVFFDARTCRFIAFKHTRDTHLKAIDVRVQNYEHDLQGDREKRKSGTCKFILYENSLLSFSGESLL